MLINQILEKYNLNPKEILPHQKGYRNTSYPMVLKSGEIVNLIIYKREAGILERIQRTNLVSNYLAEKGFSTRRTLGKIIQIKIQHSPFGIRHSYACLYNYLPGNTIPWEAYTMENIKLLGKTMAEIHQALMPNADLQMTNDFPQAIIELNDLNNRMGNYFANQDVVRAMREKLNLRLNPKIFDYFESLFRKVDQSPNHQILHLDFVRSNILFDIRNSALAISGVLDFEKTAVGPKIIDIARTLAFLIVDCKYKPEQKVRKYFLHSGYRKRGKSNLTDIKYLNQLLSFFWLHDFYKFLSHNPYESLKDNEHYLRTINLLIREKIVRSV